VATNPTDTLLGVGVLHLKQVVPHNLLRQLRAQIAAQLPTVGKPLGIDRMAVAFHHADQGQLSALQSQLCQLPALYRLALHSSIGKLLQRHCGWSTAVLSPILNLRAKLPWLLSQSPFTTVPWHQDFGASDPNCDPVQLITAWIPLTAASPFHGGLEVIPHSHHVGWLPHGRGEKGPEVRMSEGAIAWADAWLAARSLRIGHAVGLHPGMGGSALNWPLIRYSELARLLVSSGTPVILTAGQGEERLQA
jgi:hypothetical protein